MKMKIALSSMLILAPAASFAWGGRGHHTVCSVAVHLVQDKNLREFLMKRPHTMGHLCNIPDIYWKSLPRDQMKGGDSAHFIDPEIAGLKIRDVPLDFSELERTLTGQPNRFKPGAIIRSVVEEFGSSWWRADQFFRRVVARKDAFAAAVPPARQQEQDDQFPYNREVYGLMIDMGLMGHYVGDASQPFHTSADYDGYAAEHGGLHAYYEETTVAMADGDLEALVLKSARKIKPSVAWLNQRGVLASMREFTAVSHAEMPKVFHLDPMIKKSTVRNENGLQIKEPAVRESAEVGWKRFKPMIVAQMGRSARLLAQFWDQAYADAGRPNLEPYRSYRYPFTPEYVPLDYANLPAAENAEKKSK